MGNNNTAVIGDGAVLPMSLMMAMYYAGQSLHYFDRDKVGDFVTKALEIVVNTENQHDGVEAIKSLYQDGDYSWYGSRDFMENDEGSDEDSDEEDYYLMDAIAKEELDSAITFGNWMYAMKRDGKL